MTPGLAGHELDEMAWMKGSTSLSHDHGARVLCYLHFLSRFADFSSNKASFGCKWQRPNLLTLFKNENFFCHVIRKKTKKQNRLGFLPSWIWHSNIIVSNSFFCLSVLPSLCMGFIPKAFPLWSPDGQPVTAGLQFYLVFPPNNLSKNRKSLFSSRGIPVM